MEKEEFLNLVHNKMIVSCQALEGEPLYVEDGSVMPLMAKAAKMAGSPAVRANGVEDVIAIKQETNLPVIGIIKKEYPGFEGYITPTMKEVDELVKADADVIALDCTNQKRGDGLTVEEFLEQIRSKYPNAVLMADISTYEEGMLAQDYGVDMISTTLSGYTKYSPKTNGPDYELMYRLSRDSSITVIGEGRIHTPKQAIKAFDMGVWSIVVGGAITRPYEIAKRFVDAIEVKEKDC